MTAWQPILVGEDATRARAVIDDIATALATRPIDVEGRGVDLSHGEPGIGLCFAYLSRALDRPELAQQAEARLGAALDRAVASPSRPYLWSGLAGAVWAVEQALTVLEMRDDDDDPHAAVDDVLLAVLDQLADPPFDLIGGITGLAIYALERMPRPSAHRLLARVIDKLAARSEREGDGARWTTKLDELTRGERIAFPTGYCSLGVAHGNAGVLVALAGAAAWNVDGARSLAERSARWLLSQHRPGGAGGQFPPLLDHPTTHDQPSWCWGDLGIAAALVNAGSALGERAWIDCGIAVASHVAARSIESCAMSDANLCHGAVGTGHLLARIASSTNTPSLLDAARVWYRRGLAMQRPGEGLGGYLTEERNHETMAFDVVALAGMLDGAAGIAMGLGAAISSAEPIWDRAYGVSLSRS